MYQFEQHCCGYYTHFLILNYIAKVCHSNLCINMSHLYFLQCVLWPSFTGSFDHQLQCQRFVKIVLKSRLDFQISLLILKVTILMLLLDFVPQEPVKVYATSQQITLLHIFLMKCCQEPFTFINRKYNMAH